MNVLIIPEGVESSDGRSFRPGILTWREQVPLYFTDENTEGHTGSKHVGNITGLRRATVEGDTWVVGTLTYDSDEDAREAERLATEGKIAGVSADVAVTIAETDDVDDDGLPVFDVATAEIVGVTQLGMPAFAGARIVSDDLPLVAAANPKAAADWFRDPALAAPTPLTITDEGRIYGHLATWGTCHTAYSGACVTPPESESSYAYFNLGVVNIDGEEIHVGHITMGTGHAALSAGMDEATSHYDHTGTVAADVAAGEDEHGIWVAGAARPGTDLDVLRSASLSGDWRRVDGRLELVAALAVNVPGFPVPRVQARVASGAQTALVASGMVEQRSRDDLIVEALSLLGREVASLRESLSPSVTVENVTVTEPSAEVVEAAGKLSRILDT